MGDDVGLNMFGEMKADGATVRAGVRVVVGDYGNASGIGKAYSDGCGGRLKWGARLREAAAGEGVKYPSAACPWHG